MSMRNARRSEGQILRERAANCRRLAVGVGDAAFSEMLNKLAEECEAKAVTAEGGIREAAFQNAE